MLPYRDSRLIQIALGIFFALLLGYAYFEARGMLYGPSITVTSHVAEVSDPFITITGQADRISALSMNGKPITVTENGAFEEPYLLSPGLNRIILDAKDKYGRSRQSVVEVVYTPPSTGSGQAASTTPETSATTDTGTSTASTTPAQ